MKFNYDIKQPEYTNCHRLSKKLDAIATYLIERNPKDLTNVEHVPGLNSEDIMVAIKELAPLFYSKDPLLADIIEPIIISYKASTGFTFAKLLLDNMPIYKFIANEGEKWLATLQLYTKVIIDLKGLRHYWPKDDVIWNEYKILFDRATSTNTDSNTYVPASGSTDAHQYFEYNDEDKLMIIYNALKDADALPLRFSLFKFLVCVTFGNFSLMKEGGKKIYRNYAIRKIQPLILGKEKSWLNEVLKSLEIDNNILTRNRASIESWADDLDKSLGY